MATHTVSPSVTALSTRGVQAWAWATLAFFVVVVLEGAVVRATSSGAGCGARWPLCNGEILPHHPRVATIIEFAHRSLTGISTAMFALLIAWTFRATRREHPARRASLVAGSLLLTEGALGALLVLGHYVEKNASAARVFVQGIHFTNTMLLLSATTVTAVLLGRTKDTVPGGDIHKGIRTPVLLAMLATLLAGATGSVAALADTVFPSPNLRAAIAADFAASSPVLIRMRWIHPASAVAVVLCTLWCAVVLARRGQRTAASAVGANLALQVLTGVADVLMLAPLTLQIIHLLSADIFWIILAAIAVPVFFPWPTADTTPTEPQHG